MKTLVFLYICTLANYIESNVLNYSTHLAKLSSSEYYANNILQHVMKNNTNQRITVSNACIENLIAFAQALLNGDEWAFRMFDANAKLPAGLLQGYASALGSYDECLSINAQLKIIKR
ncbi:hypothetical protein FQA39_LY01249 [Lamprigera yunnana]|nr:hypothetical protein FQA39_LY01249 [Lamprigera yunnana]